MLEPRIVASAADGFFRPEPIAKRTYEKTKPAVLIINTGRRQIRSDSRPHDGEKMNCISEYDATMAPSIQPGAPRSFTYFGNRGRTMPNPIRSTKTVMKTTNSEGFLMYRFRVRRGGRSRNANAR